jgi:tRNA-intron endonuclease
MGEEDVEEAIVLRVEKNKLPRVNVVAGLDRVQRVLGYMPASGEIHVIEALYILYTGHGRAVDEEDKNMGFKEVMEAYSSLNPYAWVEFEVYYDLRRRGRIAMPGPRQHTFLLRKSKKDPRYTKYVLVLEESRRVTLDQLNKFVEEALHNNWEPVIAIVDRYGDITYYSITLFRPRTLAK